MHPQLPKPTRPPGTRQPTDGTLVDEVQASPTAASSFKTEEEEELADALCPLFDKLKSSRAWWILEIIPLRHRRQSRHDASWVPYWLVNWGRARQVPKPIREMKEKIHVHRSVKIRMEAKGLKDGDYEPKARFDLADCEWVD